MVILTGTWELGYADPFREAEQWKFMVMDYNVDKFVMTPVSGIKHKKLEELDSFDEIFDKYADLPAVFIDEKATTSLVDFEHPEDCMYVFGKAGYSPLAFRREGDYSVYIPTPNMAGGMWASQAAAIILNDRYVKNGINISR